MRTQRNIDGAYFRTQRNGKWENVCFTDLTQEERDKVMDGRSTEWLASMVNYLADQIQEIGDLFDIVGGVMVVNKKLFVFKCITFFEHPVPCKYRSRDSYKGLLMCCHSCENYESCENRCRNMVHKCGKTVIEEVHEKKPVVEREPIEKISYRIIQYDKNGDKLAVYDSYKDAAQAVGVSESFLCRAARGVVKSAGGYLWGREVIEDERV